MRSQLTTSSLMIFPFYLFRALLFTRFKRFSSRNKRFERMSNYRGRMRPVLRGCYKILRFTYAEGCVRCIFNPRTSKLKYFLPTMPSVRIARLLILCFVFSFFFLLLLCASNERDYYSSLFKFFFFHCNEINQRLN